MNDKDKILDKIDFIKMKNLEQGCGSSSRVPANQVGGPKFKPQYCKQKKERNKSKGGKERERERKTCTLKDTIKN
jgi:hypothetical protein